jgi:hypothetical protein
VKEGVIVHVLNALNSSEWLSQCGASMVLRAAASMLEFSLFYKKYEFCSGFDWCCHIYMIYIITLFQFEIGDMFGLM